MHRGSRCETSVEIDGKGIRNNILDTPPVLAVTDAALRYEGRIPLSSIITRLPLMFRYFRRKPILPISMLNKFVLISEWILILLLGNYGATKSIFFIEPSITAKVRLP